ncbi:MAG: pyruvate:ferredoxin (flavodoxin) oxidoreductase [Acidaminococcales bacterium]|jgi:pyruvate-ferredoxin/flavodoxin oxidoreductase|nr:pyruvate:ferredoxin (flavodoxin) oxidoreductase [Acidaminococcales bacterium]
MAKTKTMDGNTAAAYTSYAFTEVAAIFPITPSSPMAESVDEWSAEGKTNIFGQKVKVVEMQSEGGAVGALHGSLQSGALTTTYTASQGLLLMIPDMYKIAGELLPGVFHVSARALAANALSIFGDHQDVMATRQTGFALLAESSVQEVMDLSAVAHLSAIEGRLPFLNFFDGFRTSHEVQKIKVLDYDDLAKIVDYKALAAFRDRALSPNRPVMRGTAQNSDIYFQMRESSNKFYLALPDIVEKNMRAINKLTGKNYKLFNYYGAPDADRIIIAIGSGCETIESAVDYLNGKGEKVGMVNVHLFRPFSLKHFFEAIPKSVKKVAVLDRTKESGAVGEPLYTDVRAAFYNSDLNPVVVGGRYALGSKEFLPAHVLGIFDELKKTKPTAGFTVGIVDDVTHLSLAPGKDIDATAPGTKNCKFWGLGSDGTVGANKSAIKIIGDHTDMNAQGYFFYDSKKSGGITVSHLRFGNSPIKQPYLIDKADFIACHKQSYINQYDILNGLKKKGIFLLNCLWSPEEAGQRLPAKVKRYIAENEINFYIIDAIGIAAKLGLGGRINMIMQAAFFKLADIIPLGDAVKYLKKAVDESYGLKGQNVLDMNYAAIDRGIDAIVKVDAPADWKYAQDEEKAHNEIRPAFIDRLLVPVNKMEGDLLPVSVFDGAEDGTFPVGTSAYEKRGIAVDVPEWQPDKCIQCNQCAFVCPHAAIRPALSNAEEAAKAPDSFRSKPAVGVKDLNFSIVISVLDCTGCGNCAQVCPSKEKALVMKPLDSQLDKVAVWNYSRSLSPKPNPMNTSTVKGVQFETPLLEFSGACAGCGETPYAKLVTQLFGDRMVISNATGCSSIWGASAPSMPYTVNHLGRGPAWANSLFEDNAEFGLGMYTGATQVRGLLASKVEKALAGAAGDLKAALAEWLEKKNESAGTHERADKLIRLLEKERGGDKLLNEIYESRDYLVKRSQWIFGGDGWAYDIGYGGLDHVLASGEDVNVLVFDTEVYSNTGGQSSKATPAAAIAKFAASGKRTRKKDLGMMAISYGYVYVAQISMGADKAQTLKALREAEAYPGPSLVIAYAPCINHGLRDGMGKSQLEAKRAVDCGYWAMYRYNPSLADEGKNPFVLDSKEPTANFREFLMGEVRYASLLQQYPEQAESLFQKTENDAKLRREAYKRLANA